MRLKYKILIHIAYWVYIINQVLFPYYIDPKYPFDWNEVFGYTLASLVVFYGIYFSVPLVQGRKNIFLSIVICVLIFSVMIVVRHLVEYGFSMFIAPHEKNMGSLFQAAWIYHDIRLTVIHGIYATLIRFAIASFESQKLRNELITQTQSSELALLRSQVNPHFLFNTLNNIYSLVYQKSENAPAAVMKLSSIMRYMLYDATSDKVLLEKEIEYLQSFIELQKLRLRDRDFVDLDITGHVEGRTIAPMLLIPFVENAFKHGSKIVERPGIRIRLSVGLKSIRFEVINQMKRNTLSPKDTVGGIGMNNIKRRLNLLYPDKHSLQIEQDENFYKVDLIIYNS